MRRERPWVRMAGRIVAGLLLLGLGILFFLDQSGVLEFGNVISTWWPLILVVLGGGMLVRGPRFVGGVLVALGVLFLLQRLDIVPGDVWRYIWPLSLVAAGLAILFGGLRSRSGRDHGPVPPPSPAASSRVATSAAPGGPELPPVRRFALFSGLEERPSGTFRTGEATAVLAGIDFDLRNTALPADGARLEATAILGGVRILVPRGWRVQVKGVPILGGVSNDTDAAPADAPVLDVHATAIMGGVEVSHEGDARRR